MLVRLACYPLAAAVCVAAVATPAAAQLDLRMRPPLAVSRVASVTHAADLHGIVVDEAGKPLAGAVVSALGSTTAFAVSDQEGRFAFRDLPFGPYLVRAHLKGYVPARERIIQVSPSSHGVSTISLSRRADADQPPQVLAAGVGPAEPIVSTGGDEADADGEAHDHGELAWRLRHLKRGVLKDSATDVVDLGDDQPGHDWLGSAMGTPVRLASSLLADLPLNGQIDLLTSTSFDSPQDLFSGESWLPRGTAFLALEAPTAGGNWAMRGAITQGDLASWLVAGSYVRREPSRHRYEVGLSYAMQRYLGGHADALASVSDGSRNVGAIHGYDEWAIAPRITVGYGARYARYDYLSDRGLLSPRASITVTPAANGALRLRASASQREIAPGAEEFIAPQSGLWLPPERTFSPVSPQRGFAPEQTRHVEVAAEQDWRGLVVGVRAFRQTVDDQLVTLFGVALSPAASGGLGHYYVGSAGDVEARGWGVSVSRVVAERFSASVDYRQVDATWLVPSPDAATLSLVAGSLLRDGDELVHDVTTSVRSVLPVTDTRIFVLYKISTGFADAGPDRGSRTGTRFEVQLNQSLPFLSFTSAEWEMLVAVRNLFREELLDASLYDELLVVRPPKRVVGGVTVRF